MKIGLAQVNPRIADLGGNVERCRAAVETAAAGGAEWVILPEMALPGCPARDILFDTSFIEALQAALADLADLLRAGPPVLVGTVLPGAAPGRYHPGLYNAAALLEGGGVRLAAAKRLLRGDDVFYEPRWFVPGPKLAPLTLAGRRVGVLLGGDLQAEPGGVDPAADLWAAGAEVLVVLAASPYSRAVAEQRRAEARRAGGPLVYVNLCGGNDELIFDGRSFGVDAHGRQIVELAGFGEDVRVVEVPLRAEKEPIPPAPFPEGKGEEEAEQTSLSKDLPAELFAALTLGVRDFVFKNRLERAFVGISGGVDSAVVAVIAARALGAERVVGVALPSRYTDPRSTTSAQELAGNLGIELRVIELEGLHRAAEAELGDLLAHGTGGENVQARLRALILLSLVNRYGGLLLNTSNKTELSLGYGTAHGDLAGTLCPIADLTKPEVYALANWINAEWAVIPAFILERPPSAELRPGQVDPFDYPRLSPQIERLVQENRSNEILRRSENKRWQLGVVLRVSEKSFGRGRLVPITRV